MIMGRLGKGENVLCLEKTSYILGGRPNLSKVEDTGEV